MESGSRFREKFLLGDAAFRVVLVSCQSYAVLRDVGHGCNGHLCAGEDIFRRPEQDSDLRVDNRANLHTDGAWIFMGDAHFENVPRRDKVSRRRWLASGRIFSGRRECLPFCVTPYRARVFLSADATKGDFSNASALQRCNRARDRSAFRLWSGASADKARRRCENKHPFGENFWCAHTSAVLDWLCGGTVAALPLRRFAACSVSCAFRSSGDCFRNRLAE